MIAGESDFKYVSNGDVVPFDIPWFNGIADLQDDSRLCTYACNGGSNSLKWDDSVCTHNWYAICEPANQGIKISDICHQ